MVAAGSWRRLALAAALAALALARAFALELELDLGAGAKLDVATFGIENVTLLAIAAPWLGLADRLDAGLVIAASAGSAKRDLELVPSLRISPVDGIALSGGAGLVASVGDGPPLVPLVLGGLRMGLGRFGFLACAEIHLKPDDTDFMMWLAAVLRVGVCRSRPD